MNRYNKSKNTILEVQKLKKEKQNIHNCTLLQSPSLHHKDKYRVLVSFTLGKYTCPLPVVRFWSTKDSSQSELASKNLPSLAGRWGMATNIYNLVYYYVLFM